MQSNGPLPSNGSCWQFALAKATHQNVDQIRTDINTAVKQLHVGI